MVRPIVLYNLATDEKIVCAVIDVSPTPSSFNLRLSLRSSGVLVVLEENWSLLTNCYLLDCSYGSGIQK